MSTESENTYFQDLPAQTQKVLKKIEYPATNKDIIKQAKDLSALPNTMRELGMLPEKKYKNSEDVAKELYEIYIGKC